jgi:hypothetical protein
MFEDSNLEEQQESSSPMKTQSIAIGADPNLSKGPRDDLLLWDRNFIIIKWILLKSFQSIFRTDYVAWNGANPDILLSNKIKSIGSSSSLRVDRSTYLARGHNKELCKGPKSGLAKGSIYSQMTRSNVACN